MIRGVVLILDVVGERTRCIAFKSFGAAMVWVDDYWLELDPSIARESSARILRLEVV